MSVTDFLKSNISRKFKEKAKCLMRTKEQDHRHSFTYITSHRLIDHYNNFAKPTYYPNPTINPPNPYHLWHTETRGHRHSMNVTYECENKHIELKAFMALWSKCASYYKQLSNILLKIRLTEKISRICQKVSTLLETGTGTGTTKNGLSCVESSHSFSERNSAKQADVAILKSLAIAKIRKNIILLEDPDLHFHCSLQLNLVKDIHSKAEDCQIFISTHSPFIIKNLINKDDVKIFIFKKEGQKIKIHDAEESKAFPFSPTFNEIIYDAFELPEFGFFNELYSQLKGDYSNDAEKTIQRLCPYIEMKKWRNPKWKEDREISIITYIRHAYHHPDSCYSKEAKEIITPKILKDNIELLKTIIKKQAEEA